MTPKETSCENLHKLTIAELQQHEKDVYRHADGCPFAGTELRKIAAREGRLYWDASKLEYSNDPFAGL